MKSQSLKAKIIALCVLLSSVSVFVGAISFFSLTKVSDNYEHVAYTNLPNIKALDDMLLSFRLIRLEIGLSLLPRTAQMDIDKSIKHMHEAIATYEAGRTKYLQAEYAPGQPFGPGEKPLFNKVEDEWKEFRTYHSQTVELLASGKPEARELAHQILTTKISNVAERYARSSSDLRAWNDAQSIEWVGKAAAASRLSNTSILLVVAVGFASSLLIGTYFATSLSNSISHVVQDLAAGAGEVLQASNQIASASEQLSHAATEQAASLEQTAASVEEMRSMISRNSDNAAATEKSSAQSQVKVTEGKLIVEKMSQAMAAISTSNESIATQVNHSNESVAGIIKVMERIDKETKVIDDIVNKTELLSFNASVEAARAGEHGKGFAVVAEEVGNLARMSGEAAQKIKVMLEESVTQVEQIVDETKTKIDRLMRDGQATIQNGTNIVRQCGEVFEGVVQNVSNVSNMAADIATASEEQSRGVVEITKAMGMLDQMTQQNAAASEQCASSAEQLSSQAQSLHASVKHLTSTVHGTRSSEAIAQPAFAESFTPAPKSDKNVFPLKRREFRIGEARANRSAKQVAHATPDYDSPGFKDV